MAEKSSATATPRSLPEEWASLQHIAQHNAATPYSSGPGSSAQDYGSVQVTPYGSPAYGSDRDAHNQESGPRDDWHSSVENFYPQLPASGANVPTSAPRETPRRQIRGMTGTRDTPSSRQTTSSPPPTRAPKRAKQAKPAKSGDFMLDAPLSELTKNSTILVKDMHAFVHRSKEKRTEEKEKKNGYIVRPMNAFMLYRSAYADRAKGLFEQNNHQIVSRATGQSWRLEPKEVKDYYKELSDIERDNHQKAWPNYKFTPSKGNNVIRKRKGAETQSEGEASDLDQSDYDWTPAGLRKQKPGRHASKRRGQQMPTVELNANALRQAHPAGSPYLAYENHGPVVPAPMPVHDNMYPQQYYNQAMRNHYQVANGGGDGRFQHESYPAEYMEEARHGVPGGRSHELLDYGYPGQLNHDQILLDPALVYQAHPGYGDFTEQEFEDFNGDILGQQMPNKAETYSDPMVNDHSLLASAFDSAGQDRFEQWIQDTNGELLEL